MIYSAEQDRESLAGTHPAGLFLYPDKELTQMLFTSEQVSAGHPDKICDQISDAIVTDCLKHDRNSRVAVEAMIKDDHVYVAGEITSNTNRISNTWCGMCFSAPNQICTIPFRWRHRFQSSPGTSPWMWIRKALAIRA